jgi:hypothetical protein
MATGSASVARQDDEPGSNRSAALWQMRSQCQLKMMNQREN